MRRTVTLFSANFAVNSLSRAENSPHKGALNVTPWLEWLLRCLTRAVAEADTRLDGTIRKARFWEHFGKAALNERQVKVLQRCMRDDWQGKLTSSKWAKIAGCSQDTAGRDINDLLGRGALCKQPGGGRSTSYSVNYDGAAP